MYNFQQDASLFQYIFCFILINLIFLRAYILKSRSKGDVFVWGLMLIFCLFAFWDTDYFSFRTGFYTSLEGFRDPLYYYISLLSFNTYTIFRFIIWGVALLLLNKTIKRFEIDINTAVFIFVITYLALFSQMRGSLGLALYCYGLSLIIGDKHKGGTNLLWGVILICLSYYGHRSMILPIVLTPLILIKPNKVNAIGLLFIFLFLGTYVGSFLTGVSDGDIAYDVAPALSGAQEGLEHYASKDAILHHNWKFMLTTQLKTHSFTFMYLYCMWVCFMTKKQRIVPNNIKQLLLVCTGLFAIGISLLLVGNMGAILIGRRFLYYTSIPLCIVLASLKKNGLCKRGAFYLALLPGFLFVELFIFGKILSF